jgi:NADPH-dependent curcumin reductase CurA
LPGAKLQKLDPALGPLPDHLNALGPSGMTAYFAMQVVGAPQPGETVVIAPAAGSVGSLAGQIAKLAGARVIGIAAGDAQCAALTQDLGFDAAVDHRDLGALPDGVNLFLDGVGGATHDAVMAKLAPRGRAVLLGFISGYSDGGPPRYGAAAPVLFKRARVEGFLLADWQDRFGEAQAAWARWLAEGAIRPRSTIWNGLERTPAAFAALFGEAGVGKQLVRVSEGERE